MPQISRYYAAGRIRALEKTLLTPAALERLASAGSVAEVARVLSEVGWGDSQNQPGVERLADEHVRTACSLVREITPDPGVTDLFLVKYDILNLKALLKARLLGEESPALSENGTMEPERLRAAVAEANYAYLPALYQAALKEIESGIAVDQDAFRIDARLDILLFGLIADGLEAAKDCPLTIRAYFTARADAANMLIALRTGAMGRDADFAKSLFVPGGKLSPSALEPCVSEPTRLLAAARHQPFFEAVRLGLERYEAGEGLAPLEKLLEDHQLSLLKPHRYALDSIVPLVGYLLAREREASAVRLIVTAKAAKVPEGALSTRMRRLYTD